MIFAALLGKGKLIGLAVVGIALASAVAYHYGTVSSLQSDLNQTIAVNSTLRADLITAVQAPFHGEQDVLFIVHKEYTLFHATACLSSRLQILNISSSLASQPICWR